MTQVSRPAQLFAQALEGALNRALKWEAYQTAPFATFEGKVIKICIEPLPHTFIAIVDNRFHAQSTLHGEADASIQAPLPVWKQALPQLREDTLPDIDCSRFEISGDQILAEAFLNTLAQMEIDWEEALSQRTGDLLARQIGQGIRGYFDYKQSLRTSAKETLEEYLKYELQALPTSLEVKTFVDEVNELEQHLKTIEQRLNALN